jgi:hypothetical protein
MKFGATWISTFWPLDEYIPDFTQELQHLVENGIAHDDKI